ncbi:MAG: bifunctional hydroxymethylpyrimidine kinase/phosphomethylpyrimidine kinase [Acidimicrobiia bacterium]
MSTPARPRPTPPSVLTIAGSDSGGGAGIQADLKTFLAHGVHGTSAVTAVTAQNTKGVRGIYVLPAQFVLAQVEAVVSDIEILSTKTGMLANAGIISTVAELAKQGVLPNLVVDPVMVSASGDRLLDADAEHAYLEVLFSQALVVTPNLRETRVLVRREIKDTKAMRNAAEELAGSGARYVVIKGGHLEQQADEAIDVVFTPSGEIVELRSPRIDTKNVHGTGCTFASAIAARLALGDEPIAAIAAAKEYVTRALELAATWRLGGGRGPVDHLGASTLKTTLQ